MEYPDENMAGGNDLDRDPKVRLEKKIRESVGEEVNIYCCPLCLASC
jgi:hypothetical protein